MQIIRNALAATLLVGIMGVVPAQAAPAGAPAFNTAEFGHLDVQQVGDKGKRDGHDGRHRSRDDDDRRRHARVRCHTEWVMSFTRRGPVWYPIRVCHKRRYW